MKKTIKIYAPFDGYVKKIEEISDPAFASKSLGDGVFIIPENDFMYCPMQKATLKMIADTKHAYYFTHDEFNLLIHIGLDTVKLEGKPFNINRNVGELLTKKDIVLNLKREFLNENISLETPVLVETTSFDNYEIKFNKINQKVKHGDLLFELLVEEKSTKKIVKTTYDKEGYLQINKEVDKYLDIAQNILNLIGGQSNQINVYNCMTRLRFKIIDKKIVNENEIRKISIVKGINWAGEELQIIIGGEVYKVREEVTKIIEGKNNNPLISITKKVRFKDKIASALTSILFPTIPVLIGTGIIGGLQSILVVAGVLQNPTADNPIGSLDMWSALFYIASKVGLELIGVVFLYSTVKFLRGDIPIGLLLALLLTSRHLIGDGWHLFTLFGTNIALKTYESSVLPMIAGGFLVHYMNEWTKKWMPSSVDIVFRTAFVAFACFIVMLFTIGPFFKIIEQLLSKFVILIGKMPYGLGLGIFAMLWQSLVLTGTHVAVVTAISLPMIQSPPEPSVMYAALQIAIVGQIGATIAVAIRTKNNKIRQTCLGGLPGSIFGITEPIIYGVNLRKVWPFIYGSLGALIGGTVGGVFGLHQISRTGTGIMSYIGLGIGENLIVGTISSVISLAAAFAITFVFYFDRKNEISEIKKTNKLLYKIIKKTYSNEEKETEAEILIKKLSSKFKELLLEIKTENNYKKYENSLLNLSKSELKLQKITNSYNVKKRKKYTYAMKLKPKDKEKYNIFAEKYLNFNQDELINQIQNQINELEKVFNEEKDIYVKYNSKLKLKIENILKEVNLEKELKNYVILNYYNSLECLEINYELKELVKPDYEIFKNIFKNNRKVEMNVK